MPLAKSLLHPSAIEDLRTHKLKRLVPRPNSYFMDIKCPGCYKITTVFSHVQDKYCADQLVAKENCQMDVHTVKNRALF
ncbi:Ribosomal protein S27e, zinc-binding domain,Ribosomal protein S27e,Zinc-binding ribosomal [Cinara cedri]|uniref:Ribosomal protein S27e, zinc-binding domain,Ribosomal protein S27e,Zinc-binding ribosomal n=1 Tax=Cinara cedri TaxID=506608 RepID=A0A5E4MSU5_9HEMI|nr:Ribosomal protein S27e, zinc-binding domain,Ribosomal protein S27e,Zinc-binding ribosomal [Cinara cedri]